MVLIFYNAPGKWLCNSGTSQICFIIAYLFMLLQSPGLAAMDESVHAEAYSTGKSVKVEPGVGTNTNAKSSLTLSTAIKRTMAQNPALKVYEVRDIAMRGKIETAELKPAYELGLEVENFSGSGSFEMMDSAELTISLSSVIEMGDKRRARVGVASRYRAQLEAQKKVEALELLGQVIHRYIDVLAAQERVKLSVEAMQLARNTLLEVRKRAKAGATPEAEVKRAQAASAQAELTLSSERRQLQYLKFALAGMWGDATLDFERVSGDLYQFAKDIPFSELYALVEQNPTIEVFAAEKRLKEAEVRLAKTQASTDIRWSIGLRQFQESDDFAITAGFSMPLSSSKRNSGTLKKAMAARDEIQVRKEVTLRNLHTQLYRAYSNRQQAMLSVNKLQKEIIPSLKQALNETKIAYQRGRYSYLDYITARQELLNARRTMIEAGAAALRYGNDIEQLIAEPLPASQYRLGAEFSKSESSKSESSKSEFSESEVLGTGLPLPELSDKSRKFSGQEQ